MKEEPEQLPGKHKGERGDFFFLAIRISLLLPVYTSSLGTVGIPDNWKPPDYSGGGFTCARREGIPEIFCMADITPHRYQGDF